MGGSHSVYILMQTNLFTIGKALYDYSRILGNTARKEEADTYTHSPSDTSPTASLGPSLLEEGNDNKLVTTMSSGTLATLAGLLHLGAQQSGRPSEQLEEYL